MTYRAKQQEIKMQYINDLKDRIEGFYDEHKKITYVMIAEAGGMSNTELCRFLAESNRSLSDKRIAKLEDYLSGE